MIDLKKKKFGNKSALPSRNPNVFGQRPEELNGGDVVDTKRYRERIGLMLYIANGTRPYIYVSLCELSEHLKAPKPAPYEGSDPSPTLSCGASKFRSCYCRNGATMINPVFYVDAIWGSGITTRRSTSVVLALLCGAPVIYKSVVQCLVALSSDKPNM
ncbi:hypothetical protein PsorP6_016546 [Peronosclerospora sorghi]|uniref:Uncharacterized protein n=1 Tax=Peronosclerospora sorghi TaxID=230839 RepID=A0ACC0VLE9_9STRA|nr:hypothetical protein PsorP6_016546 [Peronosclerospora sorghi]